MVPLVAFGAVPEYLVIFPASVVIFSVGAAAVVPLVGASFAQLGCWDVGVVPVVVAGALAVEELVCPTTICAQQNIHTLSAHFTHTLARIYTPLVYRVNSTTTGNVPVLSTEITTVVIASERWFQPAYTTPVGTQLTL
jgi:hypothetical protein